MATVKAMAHPAVRTPKNQATGTAIMIRIKISQTNTIRIIPKTMATPMDMGLEEITTMVGAEAKNNHYSVKSPRGAGILLLAQTLLATFVFTPFPTLVIAVAGQAGVLSYRGWMAGTAGCKTVIDP
jgi:hypothetical protein